MKLMRVYIEGFRSIETLIMHFDGFGHKVLVGKNESGKSNILNALSLLSNDNEFTAKDKKVMYQKQANMVVFGFRLEHNELQLCIKKSLEKFVADYQTVRDLLVTQLYIAFRVTPEKREWQVTFINTSDDTSSEWYLIKETYSDIPLRVSFKNLLVPGNYIHRDLLNKLDEWDTDFIMNKLTEAPVSGIISTLNTIINEALDLANYRFPVAYWRYSEQKHTIPPSVDREAFSQNPSSCAPLQNMFLLANIPSDKIRDNISAANGVNANSLKSALDHVNRKTNEYIKKTWKEFNDVRIALFPHGTNIGIGIADELNTFDFDQRSDGFRRFVSFLLLLSATVENDSEQARNSLILIDEPETSLHPSGARDFRDKLIELGKENVVVYSTHSPSMVDSDNIENNLIVVRKGENTFITNAKMDGISPAENVYNAIGHSIYGDLKATNILLEGYTDKKTFRLFTDTDEWKKFGICFTGGVKNINHILPMLDLASRRYFILSDADRDALDTKRLMGNPAHWFTYKDLDCDAITIEDFYKPDFFRGVVKKVFSSHGINLADNHTFAETKRMAEVHRLIPNNLPSGKGKKSITTIIKNEIKVLCAKNVKKANVESQKIEPMLSTLHQKITKAQNT